MVNSLGLGKLLGGSSGGTKLMVRHVPAVLSASCQRSSSADGDFTQFSWITHAGCSSRANPVLQQCF
jgi:hypothetical protein